MQSYDVAVIGAGILGLATAREILRRHPGSTLVVLDKEQAIGQHQTGHNSGVLHSGIYYAPGSLKARLCVEGSAELYRYCADHGIPTERCGKVIVASDGTELAGLDNLYQRGVANGVAGLEIIGPERLKEIEPACFGVRALWSPNTGIVNFSLVASAYADDVRAAGGDVLTGHEISGLMRHADGVTLIGAADEVRARHVIACAGLQADRLARESGAPSEPRIVPFRGDYWLLRDDRRHLCRNMIYPVPNPAFPFLGVHLTRRIEDGSIWLGPNAVLAFAREGYSRWNVVPKDVMEALRFGGFQKLAFQYWQTGLTEIVRDYSKSAFLRSLQRYVPSLTMADMLPGPSGVRAQALSADGKLVDDFKVDVQAGQVIHVRNAPSPAATSSLAIARLIADTADQAFALAR